MKSLRFLLASLVFAGACTAGTATSTHTTPTKVIEPKPVVQLDRAAVRAKLAERRQLVFERFLAYRNARVYPINNLPGGGLRHVWLDDWGNLCAAATLISKDWGREASIEVGKANREIKLADVKSGPVADWILTSGLTHAELVAIQLPGDDLSGRMPGQPVEPDPRVVETNRMFGVYVDVERQIRGLWEENLDLATDRLMKRPDLAREILADRFAGPGIYAQEPVAAAATVAPAPR